jgi:WD40 repeat protein
MKKELTKVLLLNKIRLLLVAVLLQLTMHSNAQRPELMIPATHSARSVIISPDEKWVVSAASDGIKVWDYKNGTLIKNLAPGGNNNERFNNGRITMAIDAGSRQLAMYIADTLYLFNLESFNYTHRIALKGDRTAFTFSKDGTALFAGGEYPEDYDNRILERIDLSTGKVTLLQTFYLKTPATHQLTRLILNAGETEMIVYDAIMGSWLLDMNTNKVKKFFSDKLNYLPFDYLPNGNLLAFAGRQERVLYIQEQDAKTYTVVKKSKLLFKSDVDINAIDYVITFYSGTGKYGLYYQNDFVLFTAKDFTASPKKEMPQRDKYGWIDNLTIALTPTGNQYILGLQMEKCNAVTHQTISHYGEFPLDSYVQFVFKHTDGVCLKDRTLTFENGVFNLRLVDPISSRAKIDYSDFLYRLTKDGKTGFLYSQDYGLFRFEPGKAKIEYEAITKVANLNKKFVGMQIFEDHNLLTLIGDEGIYVMELNTFKLLYIVDIPFGLEYILYERLNKYCDISPDKSKMILFAEQREGDSAIISCVDLTNRNEIWQYVSEDVDNLRFTQDGKQLMFSCRDKLFYLDAATGKEIGKTIQLPATTYATIISPSGKRAASQIPIDTSVNAGYDIGVIDVSNRKTLGVINGTGDYVSDLVFAKNERYLLSVEYGGICFWDMEKQRQIGKLYLFENSAEWILVTPDGRFDATESALKKMYYTKGKEIIPLESLYEKYYIPGLLKQVWENTLPENLPDIGELKLPPTIKLSIQNIDRNLVVADDVAVVNTGKQQITILAEANGVQDLVTEIRLYQNGKLVQSTRNLTVEEDKGAQQLTKSFTVALNAGENNFKAIAINSQRTESIPAALIANYAPAANTVQPVSSTIQLHVVVVGINAYKNPKYNLNYALADATAFSNSISEGANTLFSKINTIFLKDADATKEGIVAAFEKIKANAQPQDLFVFYYAGHGVINDKKEFFLVPHDVTQLYGNDDALAQKGISAALLQQVSKEIKAQKQLFILDACQSAGALETIAAARGAAEEKAIAQLARSTGTQWLTASGSEQFASEFSQLGHGSFTYCLLEAFKGAADQGDKKLTVKELDAYLQTKVPEVTQKYKGTPQYPASYSYGNDFPIIIIK